MKTLTLTLLFQACIATMQAQSPLPATVIVGGDGPVDSKEFTVWVEPDPTRYDGSYSGDVSGDTGGSLTIQVARHDDPTLPFIASGTYKQKTAGTIEQVVHFANAHHDPDAGGVFEAGAFRIIFVRYGKDPGVVVDGHFIRKDP